MSKFPITTELTYIEDIDSNIFVPVLDAIEQGLFKMGHKVTDELSDEIFEEISMFLEKLFPNTDYRNYN